MAPREANNAYPDQYLTLEYDGTTMAMPHDTGPVALHMDNGETTDEGNLGGLPMAPPTAMENMMEGSQEDEASIEDDDDQSAEDGDGDVANAINTILTQPPVEVHLPVTNPIPIDASADTTIPANVNVNTNANANANQPRAAWHIMHRNNTGPGTHANDQPIRSHQNRLLMPVENGLNQGDIDPLAIDLTGPEEDDTWNATHNAFVEAAMAFTSAPTFIQNNHPNVNAPSNSWTAARSSFSHAHRQVSSDSIASTNRRRRSNTNPSESSLRGALVSPTPIDTQGANSRMFGVSNMNDTNVNINHRRRPFHRGSVVSSVLDQDSSISDDEPDDGIILGEVPDLDTTLDTSVATSETSSAPNTPQTHNFMDFTNSQGVVPTASTLSGNIARQASRFTLSPVRRLFRGERSSFDQQSSSSQINVVADEENNNQSTSFNLDNITSLNLPPSPQRFSSGPSMITGSTVSHRSTSNSSSTSAHSIRWTTAFDPSLKQDNFSDVSSAVYSQSSSLPGKSAGQNQINFSFGKNTNVTDLKYFAERGCIVQLLGALNTPRLKTVGTRMLADYAKIPQRRVAVASNRRVLEFCCRTMLEMPSDDNMGTEWPAREYAVETIRSLTATEDSDAFLMGCTGLLKALAIVVRGGPFYDPRVDSQRPVAYRCDTTVNMGLVSGKARLHACIAIMNLSCGKSNKIEIASIPQVLEAMRDVMVATPEQFSPATSSPQVPNSSSNVATPNSISEEARLKAATCVKNLSNADANDGSLLRAEGLVEALARAAVATCSEEKGATHCTTNACLALMNLSISKANKKTVFETPGVMDALMLVLAWTSPSDKRTRSNCNTEARVKACSALSNLAIGYENKIPMFVYDGFVDAILQVIETDTGEARTKACSILWSFAAEMKNQVPVVQRGDILPTLVRVAEEDHSTEARFKCVAALTLLAESLENALPLLQSGALHPLMDILQETGADPTQWKGQTASWCVGFLMNMAQSDDAAPFLRQAGVVELLAPLLTLDHYQSLKAAMAVTFICRFDKDDETYDLLRKTENVIPKIISLLHNTLSGRGGSGYKYGVFTLRSSVGCISSLASGPEFMKERIATKPVFENLLQVISDFCVDGGTKGAIVGGGRDDAPSATLAIHALQSLIEYMIPIPGSSALPFGIVIDKKLIVALESFNLCTHGEVLDETRELAKDGLVRINQSIGLDQCNEDNDSGSEGFIPRRTVANNIIENSIFASLVQGCCIGPSLHAGGDEGFFPSMIRRTSSRPAPAAEVSDITDGNDTECGSTGSQEVVRTFLLTDVKTGRLYAVPKDPSGGRAFNDGRHWCYRRGRFCRSGEVPDPNFVWTEDMQVAYSEALQSRSSSSSQESADCRGSRSIHGIQSAATAILK